MATFYLDFENGNDANDGTTFANRWKTVTSGATAVRLTVGDTIRIMGSPAPTSLGQSATWTSGLPQATKSITSSTNATPISVSATAHGYSTGDTVVITGHTTNTNANGTWEITSTGANTFTLDGSVGNGTGAGTGTVRLRNHMRVMLTTPVTQSIAATGHRTSTWTSADGVNVTTAHETTAFKEHNKSDSIAILAGFTTGLAAYYTLPSALNLSAYQQVSFWIRQSSGTVGAAGAVDIRLCSDTAGVTAVNTISIPNLVVIGRWMPVTVDLGTNLGSSIQSIALYVNTDNGAQTFFLNNIIACKASSAADSLTLTSLIGKNTTDETFWGIQSINGARVCLDADTNATPLASGVITTRGYYGTSETVTTWKRETIKQGPSLASSTIVSDANQNGAEGSPVTYSGGWDRTNMSTQNLETWLDGQNGFGYAFDVNARSWNSYEKIAGVRFSRFFEASTVGNYYGNIYNIVSISNMTSTPISDISGVGSIWNVGHICANGSTGSSAAQLTGAENLTFTGKIFSCCTDATNISANNRTSRINLVLRNNQTNAFTSSGRYIDCELDNYNGGANANFINSLFYGTTEVTITADADAQVASHKHDQTVDNHKIFTEGALISSATDLRKTPSGISWKIQPTSTSTRSSRRPVRLDLATVAVAANKLVTVKAWMYRNNSGLTMRLVCRGGEIAGVPDDVVASITTTDAWEELTLTFTPTEVGAVLILVEAWGGTTFSGWVDDMTILQAS